MSEQFRELTVGELIERLSEFPSYRPVTVIVNGTAGVITGVWAQKLNPDAGEAAHVLIGEQELAVQIVPPEWTNCQRCDSQRGCVCDVSTTAGGDDDE